MDKTVSLMQNYPNLFAVQTWSMEAGSIEQRFSLSDKPPVDNLISNVNIVPFMGDLCVLIQLASGDWEIPGGTLEPGELFLEAIQRELLEEAGAQMLTFQVFGAWYCRSSAPAPYRSHLPHPEFYRVVGCGQVKLVGLPSNPANAEDVAAVECVPLEEASRRFLESGRPDLAELYRLAATIVKGATIRSESNVENS